MDYEIDWHAEARDDVNAISEHIALSSVYYANIVLEKISQIVFSLKQFPLRGRIVPQFEDEELREVFVYDYRIIYRVEDFKVLIVMVIHGSRLLEFHSGRLLVHEVDANYG